LEGSGRRAAACHDDVGLQADQLLSQRSYPIAIIAAPAKVHPHVPAIGPTQVRKRLSERRDATFPLRIVFVVHVEHTDAPHPVAPPGPPAAPPPLPAPAPVPPSPQMNPRRRIGYPSEPL